MANVFERLNGTLRQRVAALGYRVPTPIQQAAIGPILAGRDVMGCAQTGTGKTAAFVLPLLHRLAAAHPTLRPTKPLVLILAPTRELAAQIAGHCESYAQGLHLPSAVVFGGVNIRPQAEALQRGVAVLVATPGRLLDLCGQGAVALDAVQAVVLDEADRMLDMGFLPDMKKILQRLPKKRQSLFFSATLSPEVTALARQFILGQAVTIRINPDAPTVERVEQRVFFVDKENKYALLKWLLESPKAYRVIVFPRMKHGADRLSKQLSRDGFPAAALHGDKSQAARLRALEGFRSGAVQVLVATDIAARGIDVEEVSMVVNYDLPDEPETYVHRIGRTARAGAAGEAVSLVCAHDRQALREIEAFIGREILQVRDQPLHSEAARLAMGAEAVRPKRAPHAHASAAQGAKPAAHKPKPPPARPVKPFWQAAGKPARAARREGRPS